jgi:hypothetical protein
MTICLLGAFPRNISHSNSIITIGTVATIRAAMPEGISCSDQVTNPLPPKSKRAPTIMAERQWNRRGSGTPLNNKKMKTIEPAIKNRVPAIRNGGMVSIAILIAK